MNQFEKPTDVEQPETEKPQFLYHSSPNKEIVKFEPRVETTRDNREGPKVFATSDLALASAFLVESNDSWTSIGRFDKTFYLVISDRQRFEQVDKGGAIYTLPSETFNCDKGKGMGDLEWTSDKSVEPTEKTIHQSSLETMMKNGVQVYFVDQQTFDQINEAKDHGLSILRGLESENQKRGINILPLIDKE